MNNKLQPSKLFSILVLVCTVNIICSYESDEFDTVATENQDSQIPPKAKRTPTTDEIEKARLAIRNCQIRNMHGTYPAKICLLRTQFIDADIFGPLVPGENRILLHGPTGNGKTTLSQNIAEEGVKAAKGPIFHREDIGTKNLIDKRIKHMQRLRQKSN